MELYNTVLEQHIHVMILNTRDEHHHIVRHILLFGITHIAYFVCEQCSPLCLMLIFDFFFCNPIWTALRQCFKIRLHEWFIFDSSALYLWILQLGPALPTSNNIISVKCTTGVLEKPLEKKAGRKFAPPTSKRLIYFIDDLNMPAVDVYGTVQPHTLIRQHLDYNHWWVLQSQEMIPYFPLNKVMESF